MSLQELIFNLKKERSLEWGKFIAVTGSAQAVIQGVSFVSSILIIRLLPTQEYALYTLASVMFANLGILADSGIKTSVMAQGGKVWQKKGELGDVLATGFYLRRIFATGSFVIACPIMLFLLRHHGANWWMAVGIVFSIIPAYYATLSGSLLEIVPQLQQKIMELQKIGLKASFIRLGILGFALFFFPFTIVAMLAFGLSQLWANIRLRDLANSYIDAARKSNIAVREEILKMVKRLMPESVYLVISGHITVWLISFFGDTAAVAQVGALGRLAMVLSIFTILFGTLVSPRFARLPYDKKHLTKRFGQVQMGLTVLCIGVVIIAWIFASEMLWLLGSEYAGLEREMVLLVIGNCIGFIAVSTFHLCTSRGWVINPVISIPVSMAGITCGAFLFEVSELYGVFLFNIFNNSVILVLHVTYGFYRLRTITHTSQLN
ncbi:lipopolysaccharide biosynthesis protein [Salinimicrobium sp. TH3]|uniref:lipopolysaccharide biosynthesis protein n=1 Tax=Salinimicrobium sp. TH3 TaxID=2997342 RepID=UPI002276D996|nr:polysaccharide biosynthesis protein [Salinimicrobium sp. TH3]MCY2687952.1 polysaccharide biosynthesis protein [Salinimicrobium sp. TH3]